MGRGLLIVCAVWLAWAGPASAACNSRPASDPIAQDDRFVVHGGGDGAGALLSIIAEARLFHRSVLGMPDALPDSCANSPKVDVYVQDLPEGLNGATFVDADTPGAVASWVAIDVASVRSRPVVSHELFHVLQNAITAKDPDALREATAEWAAARFTGTRPPVGYDLSPGLPLDCGGTCSYLQWPFYQHLAERFGNSVVRALHEEAYAQITRGSGAPHLDALDKVIADRGGTLAGELSGFAARTLTGSWAFGPLQGLLGRADSSVTLAAADAPPIALTMPHLSARSFAFTGDPGAPCQVLPLNLRVALPASAAGAAPSFVRDGGEVKPLAVSDGVATLTDEWNTCASNGRLVVAHGGRAPDDAAFTVTATLTRAPARPPVAPAVQPPAKARLVLNVARRIKLVRGRLRFKIEVARAGRLTVRVDTKPRVRRVVLIKSGTSTVSVRIPRKAQLAKRGNRLSLAFADPLAAKPVTTSARVVLRRR